MKLVPSPAGASTILSQMLVWSTAGLHPSLQVSRKAFQHEDIPRFTRCHRKITLICPRKTKSAQKPKELEQDLLDYFRINVIGNINLYNAYIPLILKGTAKKVITLSTGHADIDMVTKYKIEISGPYTISKAALNMTVAKYHAEYAEQGVLFMSICPGFVETGKQDNSELRSIAPVTWLRRLTRKPNSPRGRSALPTKVGCYFPLLCAGYEEIHAGGGG